MRSDLQERFLKVAQKLERLDRLSGLVANAQHTSPRSLVASAAVAGAEFLAAASGNSGDPGIIHRAYEEIFASLENSEAIAEMLSGKITVKASKEALNHVKRFRYKLLASTESK